MAVAESTTTKKQSPILRLVLSLVLLIAYIIAVEWLWGWSVLLAAWRSIPLLSGLIALAIVLFSYVVRAWRVYDYFKQEMAGRFALCMKLSFYHNLINNLMPMRSGELAFPILMSRYFKIEVLRSGSVLFWFRLIDLHTILLLGLLAYHFHGDFLGDWMFPALALWLTVPFILYLAHTRLARWLGRFHEHRWRGLLFRILNALPQNPTMFWRSWLWTVINWVVKLLAMAWVLQQFADMPFGAASVGVIAGDLTSVLPVNAPAGLGTYETGVATALLTWSVNFDVALAAAVNLHLFLLTSSLLSGVIAWFIRRDTPVIGNPA